MTLSNIPQNKLYLLPQSIMNAYKNKIKAMISIMEMRKKAIVYGYVT